MRSVVLADTVLVDTHQRRFGWSISMLRTLLENKSLCRVISGVVLIYFLLLPAGLVLYRCPLHATTGLLCAGCGLSTAMLSMLRGNFVKMWSHHPFAPYFAMLGIMVIGSALLPESVRVKWNAFWIGLEIRSRLHGVILIILCVFGALRLLGQLRIT